MSITQNRDGQKRSKVNGRVPKQSNVTWIFQDTTLNPDPDGLADELLQEIEDSEREQTIDALARKRELALKGDARARRRIAAEGFRPPEDLGSLAEQRRQPAEEEPQLVEGLIPTGITLVNAQYKAGKTTLAINLAADLATGEPFLGKFGIDKEFNGNIGIWNLEVPARILQDWLFARVPAGRADRRIRPLHLRGTGLTLGEPVVDEWAVGWLRKNQVEVWIIDPLSKLYHGAENANDEFNEWWRALEGVASAAGVRSVVLIHHTGHGERGNGDADPRARGASAMMGNPDSLISYRHSGDLGNTPHSEDTNRWLKAFGRNIGQPEICLEFDAVTNRLRAVEGAPSRTESKKLRLERDAALAVFAAESEAKSNGTEFKGINKTELESRLGAKAEFARKAIEGAVGRGWIRREEGKGRSQLHFPGDHPSVVDNSKKAAAFKPRTADEIDGEDDE